MGFIVVFRNAQGNPEWLQKVFTSEMEAYQTVKLHRIYDYEILTEAEFQQFYQILQQQSQQGYQQNVNVSISPEEEEVYRPPRHLAYKGLFRPVFMNQPRVKPPLVKM